MENNRPKRQSAPRKAKPSVAPRAASATARTPGKRISRASKKSTDGGEKRREGKAPTAKKTPFWAPFAKKESVKREEPEERRRPMRERPLRPKPHARPAPTPPPPPASDEPMRLNKYLAHCGIAARRQSAEYVKQGLVTVNGEMEPNPGYPVQPGDEVKFKGQIVRLEEQKVYILMNKPKDVITTSSDEKGRKTVLDIVGKKVKERIFPVGRLDRQTSGLLLLTNDGDLAKKLSHPSHKVQKVYHVTLDKPFIKNDFERVQKGLQLEDGIALVDSLHYIEGRKDELEIGLHIGKNRIVRRIFEHLGYEVTKLDRTYYAGLTKKDIGRGHFRHLTEKEVIMLKHFK